MTESQEQLNNIPETLRPIEETNIIFAEKVKGLNDRAREKLPQEIKNKISPLRMIGEGLGKSALGLGVDIIEGVTLASLTFGLSEIFPLTEYVADFGTAKFAEKLTNRKLRPISNRLGYMLSWVPVLGDIASPTLFDGIADIYVGTKVLMDTHAENGSQLTLNPNLV